MNKLLFSPDAKADLEEIREYIADELESLEAADRTLRSILTRIRELEKYANLGARLSAVTEIENEYRFLVCGKYRAFYRVEEDVIYVDRILYGRRDFMRVLLGEEDE